MKFVRRITWIRKSATDVEVPITDCVSLSSKKTTEIKNNILNLNLKNSPSYIATDNEIIGEYITSDTKSIKFEEDDEIKVWSKFITDASEINTEWWGDDNFLGSFVVEGFSSQTMEDNAKLIIKSIDGAFYLFNKVYTYSYGVINNFTSPGIIRHMCRQFTEANQNTVTTFLGTQNDAGVEYIVNAKFLSEGGYITDYRTETGAPTTDLNGALNDSDVTITVDSTSGFESEGTIVINSEHIAYTSLSATEFLGCTRAIDETLATTHSNGTTVYQGFPLVLMSKIWQPLFEWVGEISQTDQTNYLTEIQEGGTIFYNRAFLFWLDKNNAPHWMYPDDTADLTITLGEEGARAFNLKKSIFDAVNFIIYNCGEDMYGNGIIHYVYDESSEVSSLKMRYQPMSKIVQTLITEDRSEDDTEGRTRETTNQDILKQFVIDGDYPIEPSFLKDANNFRVKILGTTQRSNVANDGEYNDCLREACKWRGLQEALKITRKRLGMRYSGTIALRGVHLNPGDLIELTNPWVGLNSKLLRVMSVTQQQNATKWETILDVEEDESKVVS